MHGITLFLAQAADQGSTASEAAAAPSGTIVGQLVGVARSAVGHLDILNHPDKLLDILAQVHYIFAAVLLVVGILCILNGWRWHRWVIITCAFVSGFAIGWLMSRQMEQPYIIAGALALTAAVIAHPLLRFAVVIFGGLTGAFIGANIWTALGYPADTHWAGALSGLILVGMASFMMFKHVVVLFTSIGGSAMAVFGAISLLLWVPEWREGVTNTFVNNQILIPLLVTVAAVIGLVLQEGQAAEDEGGEDAH